MTDEFSIDDINPEEDVASGMHTPAGEAMWRSPSIGLADDESEEEELLKEALGLTDIPSSINGGEVLDFQGVPQNPGLSREEGDDEETDYYGAAVGVDDLPPENYKKELKSLSRLLSPENNLQLKSIIKSAMNIGGKPNREGAMIKDLNKLEKLLRKNGKDAEADVVLGLKKRAAAAGALVGGAAGLISGILPGLSLVPMPVRVMAGGALGSQIQNYFDGNSRAKEELQQQAQLATDLGMKLSEYGVTKVELQELADGKLTAVGLVENIRKNPSRRKFSEPALQKLAQQYIDANNKITASVKQAYTASGGKDPDPVKLTLPERVPVPAPVLPEERKPIASPAREPAKSTAKGSITIPGDPYTYDKNPNGEGYVVVSGPSSIGAVLKPGTEAFEKVKAAELAAPGSVRAPSFAQGQALAKEGKFLEAAAAFQKSYDESPSGAALFNMGKAYYDGGDKEKALEAFTKYKNEYPEEWAKNEGLIPEDIRTQLQAKPTAPETPAISANEVPEEYKVTPEKIEAVLSKFLNGVPIRMQVGGGTGNVMDSRRARRLAERYIRGIADVKDAAEGVGLASTGLATDFGARIETGIRQAIERGTKPEQLPGLFNGLIWQALREGWAKWKDAPLKKNPTERSEERRLKQLERQDSRDQRRIERGLRREGAKKEARHNLIEKLHKAANS